MQRIVKVRDGIVGAVDREGVLDQIVGSQGQEAQPLHERRQGQGRRRDLDHPADRNAGGVALAALVELLPGLAQERERLLDFVRVHEHR